MSRILDTNSSNAGNIKPFHKRAHTAISYRKPIN